MLVSRHRIENSIAAVVLRNPTHLHSIRWEPYILDKLRALLNKNDDLADIALIVKVIH